MPPSRTLRYQHQIRRAIKSQVSQLSINTIPEGVKKTYVVLGSDSAVKVRVEERELLENVPTNTGDLAEEEKGEDTGARTECASNGTTIFPTNSLASL